MVEVFASWTVIFVASIIMGAVILRLAGYRNSRLYSLDSIIMAGLIFITWYAQFFSIFYKVGVMALFFLFCMLIVGGGYLFISERLKNEKNISQQIELNYWKMLFIGIIIIVTMGWTCISPQNYDTSLYHAQAIEWIEKYGVIRGLGNLHNRLAYNSAFMSLQALFSFSWHFGRSLHAVNGYLCTFFLCYAVLTSNLVKGKKVTSSDFIKLIMIFYIVENRNMISSPGSDISTLLTVLYICSKWCWLMEEEEEDPDMFGALALICVFAMTLKLSAAAISIIALYPAYEFIRKRRWKKIGIYIIFGAIILAPFLIRNIIISGYLLYPYAQIDLFNVDWKMPLNILKIDSREIMAWGKGINNVRVYNEPFGKWFPIWIQNLQMIDKFIFGIGIISFFAICVIMIKDITKKSNFVRICFFIGIMCSEILWFKSAPLMRYGKVYLIIFPAYLLGLLTQKMLDYRKELYIGVTIFVFVLIPFLGILSELDKSYYVCEADYDNRDAYQINWSGITVCIPVAGDQIGYAAFPSTPYVHGLDIVELRDGSLNGGFRIKQGLQDMSYDQFLDYWRNR